MTAKLNATFNNWKIYFNNVGFDYINNDQYGAPSAVTINNYTNLFSVNSKSNAIDVYLLPNGATTFGGVAQGITGKALILDGNLIFANGSVADVVSHEMGHCFNLFHTFHGTAEIGGCAELVNGSNSTTCGDFISDTPADPVNQVGACQNNCNFAGNAFQCNTQDANGQTYAPNLRNVMSYGPPVCLNMFTSRQANRMRAALRNAAILAPVRSISADITGTYTNGGPTYTAFPGSNGVSLSSSNPTCYINFSSSQTGTTFSWQVTSQSSSGAFFSTSNGGRSANITCNPGKQLSATCTITTTCGTVSYSFSCYNTSGGGFRMAAYPNPANQDMTVAAVMNDENAVQAPFEDQGMAADKPVEDRDLVDIDASVRLFDKNNTVVREGKLHKGKLNFSVAKLPDGIYYLQMIYDEKQIRKQIIVQH